MASQEVVAGQTISQELDRAGALVRKCRSALREVRSIREVKHMQALVKAAWTVADAKREVAEADGVCREAAAAKLWCERVLGEKLREMRANGELARPVHENASTPPVTDRDRERPQTLAQVGVTKNEAMHAARLAEPSEQDFERAVAAEQAKGEPTRAGVLRRLRPAPEPAPEPPKQQVMEQTRTDRIVDCIDALSELAMASEEGAEQVGAFVAEEGQAETLGRALQAGDRAIALLRQAMRVVAPALGEASRPRNDLWDAIALVCYGHVDTARMTKAEAGRVTKAWSELHRIGATLDEVHARSEAYQEHWQGSTLTPTALASNWNTLAGMVGSAGRMTSAQKASAAASSKIQQWLAEARELAAQGK